MPQFRDFYFIIESCLWPSGKWDFTFKFNFRNNTLCLDLHLLSLWWLGLSYLASSAKDCDAELVICRSATGLLFIRASVLLNVTCIPPSIFPWGHRDDLENLGLTSCIYDMYNTNRFYSSEVGTALCKRTPERIILINADKKGHEWSGRSETNLRVSYRVGRSSLSIGVR